MKKLFDFLTDEKISFIKNEPLSAHTSFKIGGNADGFIEVKTTDELKAVIHFINENDFKYFVIGNGSNILVRDEGFRGVVIKLVGEFTHIKAEDERLISGAGAKLITLCTFALEGGLSGLEFAYGIPGSVGGAVFMNAGAYGGEIKDVITSVTAMDSNGNIKTYLKEELDLSYRHSIFEENGEIVLFASFALKRDDKNSIKLKMNELMSRRKEKQPLEFSSAGSTFKRPEGHFAGALIEGAGLKGFSVGGAQVSEKHAGFVINKGSATCADVLELIDYCQRKVKEKYDVFIEPEVRII